MTGVGGESVAVGPLAGLRVVEFSAIGPVPFSAMLLADLGAEVIRIERPGGNGWDNPIVDRGRPQITLDLRSAEGRNRAIEIVSGADVLMEGLRPGTMERLGLGPDELCALNPRLIYGRMTGWGQNGPLARVAGHDINYIALTGALAAIGREGDPATVPMNLVGDFGGGALYLVFGIMAALYERQRSSRGQVVDAAIVDGVSSMMATLAGLAVSGRQSYQRDRNVLAGAAPFYRCYLCADGKEISVGAIEERFYLALLDRIGAPSEMRENQNDPSNWHERIKILAAIFVRKTRDEWCEILEGVDVCFAPVMELGEAPRHAHIAARETFVVRDGITQVAPAPRFSRTPGVLAVGRSAEAILADWTRTPR
jgi:alpha-methylacyl-CoA racemase